MKVTVKAANAAKPPHLSSGSTQTQPIPERFNSSTFSRCISIIRKDIYHLIHPMTEKEKENWQDYKAFCELVRSKK